MMNFGGRCILKNLSQVQISRSYASPLGPQPPKCGLRMMLAKTMPVESKRMLSSCLVYGFLLLIYMCWVAV